MTLIDDLRGKLVVSCQAYPGEPLRDPATMAKMAQAVVIGGAAAVRLQGIEDIQRARAEIDVPIIGLVKEGHEGVYITPSLELAKRCAAAGAEIVAIDASDRPRKDGLTFTETITGLKDSYPDVLAMADCDSMDTVHHAVAAGADLLGTTLAGYTDARAKTDGPDFEFIQEIKAAYPDHPVIAEGRIHSPDQARRCLSVGAQAVVVGTAITHPTSITGWFVDAIR